jgi:site-specific DNA-methyltransferase (adenine-specific)
VRFEREGAAGGVEGVMTPYATGKDWTLYAGECVKVMRDCIADDSIDLTVTSPPYDPVYLVDGRLMNDCKNGQRDYNGYEWDFVDVATQLWRVTKPGGVVVWVVGDKTIDGSETGTPERQKLFFMDLGFRCHDTMIYRKLGTPPLNHNRYEQAFEFVYVFSKGTPAAWNPLIEKTRNAGKINTGTMRNGGSDELSRKHGYGLAYKATRIEDNIWGYQVGNNKSTKDDVSNHPAIFPEALAHDHIISWSNPGDTVLDPFVGSGTTAKMALMTGRKTIGIDISTEYLDIAKQRIELTRLPLFEQSDVEVTAEQLGLTI